MLLKEVQQFLYKVCCSILGGDWQVKCLDRWCYGFFVLQALKLIYPNLCVMFVLPSSKIFSCILTTDCKENNIGIGRVSIFSKYEWSVTKTLILSMNSEYLINELLVYTPHQYLGQCLQLCALTIRMHVYAFNF